MSDKVHECGLVRGSGSVGADVAVVGLLGGVRIQGVQRCVCAGDRTAREGDPEAAVPGKWRLPDSPSK
jgi:hypothetical protein